MAAAQGPHHGPAAHPGGEQGRAHAVPQPHEGHGPRGNAADPLSQKAGRTQGGEVAPHTSALLHGERRIPQRLEDTGEVVRDRTHDKAVEQGQVPIHTGAGDDPPARQKPKTFEQIQISRCPYLPLGRLDGRQCVRKPLLGRAEIGLPFGPIAGLPDGMRDGRLPVVHAWSASDRETPHVGKPAIPCRRAETRIDIVLFKTRLAQGSHPA